MSISDMDRKMAARVFRERAKKVLADLRTLSLHERFRAVADFVEEGQPKWAYAVALECMRDLQKMKDTISPKVEP